jgi:hypothetical protein
LLKIIAVLNADVSLESPLKDHLTRRNHLEEQAADWRILLKWMLKKRNVRVWAAFNWVRIWSSCGIFRTRQ